MAFLVQEGVALQCPHGAPILVKHGTRNVVLSGVPALSSQDSFQVLGCPNDPPCAGVIWIGNASAGRVFIDGLPALLDTGSGMCVSAGQTPLGPV